MATYEGVCRTNYFRVTDEEKYAELFSGLTPSSEIYDFTKTQDGQIYHGFGSYSPINFEDDSNMDYFFDEMKKILPDDEAVIFIEAGNENLRYVTGYATVCTNKGVECVNLDQCALQKASEMLGKKYNTQLDY